MNLTIVVFSSFFAVSFPSAPLAAGQFVCNQGVWFCEKAADPGTPAREHQNAQLAALLVKEAALKMEQDGVSLRSQLVILPEIDRGERDLSLITGLLNTKKD